jgi:hypothetical protein
LRFFYPRKKYLLFFYKKWFGLHFGRFFSKTHLVTLILGRTGKEGKAHQIVCGAQQHFLAVIVRVERILEWK